MSEHSPSHPLTAISTSNLAVMLSRYGFSPQYLPKVAMLAVSSVATAPLRLLDRTFSWLPLKRARFDQPPVFIVGHWRSGTTHLHNLMCRDPQYCYPSMKQCMAADYFIKMPDFLRGMMGKKLPSARPMDNVKMSLDEPQEEELALTRTSTLSFNHAYHFPQKMRRIFERSVLFEGDGPAVEARWKRDYMAFLRRLMAAQPGLRLCLKNPPNTARMRQILDMFPDARFIHIYRNPYVVYESTMHLWKSLLPLWALQNHDPTEVEQNILYFYRRLMERYFEDEARVPRGQLSEVRFEQLEADPLGELERVYAELGLQGFAESRPAIAEYAGSLSGYKKNRYAYDPEKARRVREHWDFTIDRWGYAPPAA